MKIFLGYPNEFLEAAKQVYEFLRSCGHDVWFDKGSLPGGIEWDRERDRGQRNADLVIHLVADVILKRKGVVIREIKQTLRQAEDQPFNTLYVIFMRLHDFRLPVELTFYQYINFYDGMWKEKLYESLAIREEQLGSNEPLIPQGETLHEEPMANGPTILPEETTYTFSDATEKYEASGTYIAYSEKNLYWKFVNSAILTAALDGFFGARSEFADADVPGDPSMRSFWQLKTDEFFRQNDFVSIRFYAHHYFYGAAHPNHGISTVNFFGQTYGTVSIEQLLHYDIATAKSILSYCEKVIEAQYAEEYDQKVPFFDGYKDNDEQVWALISQYNFDRKGLTINFSPYDILPYALGEHEVFVPWGIFDDRVAERYRTLVEEIRGH